MFAKETLCLIVFLNVCWGYQYQVIITGNDPIVKGATLDLLATLYNGDSIATGKYNFRWRDNAVPTHTRSIEGANATDQWSITYEQEVYPQGQYTVQVIVQSCYYFLCHDVSSYRYDFYITETLNGELDLLQHNQTRPNKYVSSKDEVQHWVNMTKSDLAYVKKATQVATFWFVDCVYYGLTNDFRFAFNYTKPEEKHVVEALVVADFRPLPTTTVPPTSTTSLKPNVTTTTIPSSMKPSVTTHKTVQKRSVVVPSNTSKIMVPINGSLVPYNGTFPYVCNSSIMNSDPQKTYGYFQTEIKVKDPVMNVNVTGNNWLQHGDLLSLNVQCKGSKPLEMCVDFRKGSYNVTGNETCREYVQLETCRFPIQRYLAESMQYTVLIIIKNDVSRKVMPVAVTIYEVKRQPQLSVVVVPVAFSLVAVVIVIFAIAYYLQNRSRFTVEVADFNFGKQYTDMEYKTFSERLKDSITNAFTRAPSPSESEVPVWPPGSRKYGSMM